MFKIFCEVTKDINISLEIFLTHCVPESPKNLEFTELLTDI